MKYHLILTRQALGDRDDAYNWYCEHYSENFANRWYVGLAEAIESLRDNPSRCHRAHEDMHVTFDLYELLFGRKSNKHRILF
ncbi:MAG: type II toxin-antitoxin system RelE/ParE family toxin [Pirellulales bacterium]|nr:type II toxin-antitoxin system RelE/ParE family toxin [Pirellulales bacterium]